MKAEAKHQILVSLDIINRELKKLETFLSKDVYPNFHLDREATLSKIQTIEYKIFTPKTYKTKKDLEEEFNVIRNPTVIKEFEKAKKENFHQQATQSMY